MGKMIKKLSAAMNWFRVASATLLIAMVAASVLSASVVKASERPNVIVFLADDAGWGDYGHSGNQMAKTPRIDSLARDGVALDRFFVCPVCAPTRAEFLTGRYHPRGGVRGVSTGQERLDLNERTIADAFRAAGYATGAFGKWHNGSQWPYHPQARGFQEYFGHTSGHWGEYFNPPLEDQGQMVPTEGYIVDVCTDRALDFIDRNHQRPFFCYVPFTTPHSPWAVPESDWLTFRDQPLPQTARVPEQEVADETRCVHAMLANQDRNVGRILDRLKQYQLEENTLVVYFSDNGPNTFRWNERMKGRKGTTDEGGVRSVCYLRWNGRLPIGKVVEPICGAIDLLPTLTALAGIARVGERPLDGRDLSPILLGPADEWPDRMVFSTWAGRVSVRTQTHRLDDQGQLFDMVRDPGQTTPIQTQQPGLAKQLADAVQAWRVEMFGRSETTAPRSLPAGRNRPRNPPGSAVDPRPFPVGYREFPRTMLPARDGTPVGKIRRSSSAPNCSYFVNWTSLEDAMVWSIDIHITGRYAVTIDYTCKLEDTGSLIELRCGDASVRGRVTTGFDPPLFSNQDTLPRPPAESPMKPFRTLDLGTLDLNRGLGELTLKAIEIPGKSVMDVRRVTLTLIEP